MSAEPYPDVATHLRDELERAWLRVEYQVRLAWTKGRVAVTDDVIGATDIGRLFAVARGDAATGDDAGAATVLEQWLARHRACEARIRATVDANIRRKVIDVSSHGLLAVVLYSTPTFNASQVNIGSVVFAGAHVAKSRLRDVDCDGDLDLVLKFRIQDTEFLDIYADLLAEADQTINGKLDRSVERRQTAMLAITGKTLDDHVFQSFDTLDLLLSGRDFKDLIRELAAAHQI